MAMGLQNMVYKLQCTSYNLKKKLQAMIKSFER